MPESDGRLAAAETDIDHLQQSMTDGFTSLHQRIGELSGTLTSSHAAILQRLDAQMVAGADLTRRMGAAESTLAAHGVRLDSLDASRAASAAEGAGKRTAAYGRRWQWIAWVIAALATLADLVRAIPHLFSPGSAP